MPRSLRCARLAKQSNKLRLLFVRVQPNGGASAIPHLDFEGETEWCTARVTGPWPNSSTGPRRSLFWLPSYLAPEDPSSEYTHTPATSTGSFMRLWGCAYSRS